jgi:hypothetical protein
MSQVGWCVCAGLCSCCTEYSARSTETPEDQTVYSWRRGPAWAVLDLVRGGAWNDGLEDRIEPPRAGWEKLF